MFYFTLGGVLKSTVEVCFEPVLILIQVFQLIWEKSSGFHFVLFQCISQVDLFIFFIFLIYLFMYNFYNTYYLRHLQY